MEQPISSSEKHILPVVYPQSILIEKYISCIKTQDYMNVFITLSSESSRGRNSPKYIFYGDSREKQQKNLANGAAIEYKCMEGN